MRIIWMYISLFIFTSLLVFLLVGFDYSENKFNSDFIIGYQTIDDKPKHCRAFPDSSSCNRCFTKLCEFNLTGFILGSFFLLLHIILGSWLLKKLSDGIVDRIEFLREAYEEYGLGLYMPKIGNKLNFGLIINMLLLSIYHFAGNIYLYISHRPLMFNIITTIFGCFLFYSIILIITILIMSIIAFLFVLIYFLKLVLWKGLKSCGVYINNRAIELTRKRMNNNKSNNSV